MHWAGARLADLASSTGLATRRGRPLETHGNAENLLDYAAMATPDGDYYVGLDMASALHPQTLLCYEMEGRPLTPEHGAPLRLATRSIRVQKPQADRYHPVHRRAACDYWAERGYDWYAGH